MVDPTYKAGFSVLVSRINPNSRVESFADLTYPGMSAYYLLINRPPTDILEFAPGTKMKAITIDDREDITTYVHTRLHANFKRVGTLCRNLEFYDT